MKFKNRLDAPESIHMRGFSPKNEQIWPRGLGCRGGCYGFGGFSPCISITSVDESKPISLFAPDQPKNKDFTVQK